MRLPTLYKCFIKIRYPGSPEVENFVDIGLSLDRESMKETVISHLSSLNNKKNGVSYSLEHIEELSQVRWISWEVLKSVFDTYGLAYVNSMKIQDNIEKHSKKYSKPVWLNERTEE